MPFFEKWRAERGRRRKAAAFAAALLREPEPADIEWLARVATRGDLDHAQWELRYARRALGLLAAQRDALDDETGATVARALDEAFSHDGNIAAAMRALAERQFNARLSAYRDALHGPGATAAPRLGQCLIAFAGGSFRNIDSNVARAGDLLSAYLAQASAALRDVFGAASLPEHTAPSAVSKR